ncbi:DnaD domain protein [Ferviditalea candida]|uniref:DnaD domain protein n=1 Tax=Ferviditalea candida TaxID=3108399 RepID=A0ABU5ZD94_9BACL|nr:DnaD domain protein [Paenibacillaceae bacterium T2]
MKISNSLEYTENHRYYVYRDFSLSSLDYRMLHTIYQPLTGSWAIGLYLLMYQQLAADKIGYSALEQQRRLFLSLGLEPSEKGRKYLIEQTSKLEAVGLLQTSRKYLPANDDFIYEYRLVAPLSPDEFFRNQHLIMLLRDKVGKFMVLSLSEEFRQNEPEELEGLSLETQDLSMPFYELFKLNSQAVDLELEQALAEIAVSREQDRKPDIGIKEFQYADIITRFPRESMNRKHVESLKRMPHQLAAINYMANKFMLSLPEICRLLDEDGVFSEDGELQNHVFQQKANENFWQTKKRSEDREIYLQKALHKSGGNHAESVEVEEKPVDEPFFVAVPDKFKGQCDIRQYNTLLRNSPYTKVIGMFFPGSVPGNLLKILQNIDFNYKLNEEVINVLIHYLMVKNKPLNTGFIESIVSNLLSRQIETFEKAVEYFRESDKVKEKPLKKPGQARGARQKPKIPIVTHERDETPISEEELEEIKRMAEKLKK